ncbi:hypothetical protein [Actinomadura madurae]|uniref:hypothetical protein n=1 Tax=Actinomadura madurae TaxID=1993 RepID=UPI0020D24A76|nr:hypothetical protein [Actinomadura madurae]MCP9954220.1 hypothetical protein [Actinomadura madurae]MCP9983455.1 hypothetical protein [Actinomadura madurae]
MAIGVDGAVLVSTALSLALAPRLTRDTTDPPPGSTRGWARPEVFLGLVVLLVYVNQVLFTVYVLRVHGGDASFIARYLPEGWFALEDGPAMRGLADRFPLPELLAPSVLRVQAFLELPLVLLAYCTVLRWLDRRLYRRLAGSWLVWAASISYTFVFCTVEWDLHNPYTADDIVIRVCSAIATPLLLQWLARQEGAESRTLSFAQMLLFAISVWALGHLVLTVYDTALLYNLGHTSGRLPGAAIALCVLVGARWASSRVSVSECGAALSSVVFGVRWALLLFFVPALAVRYGVNFGTPLIAAAAGLVIAMVAGVCALRDALAGEARTRIALWAVQALVAVFAGAATGYAAVRLVTDTYYEAGLLRGAATSFAVVIAVAAVTDRWCARTAPATAPVTAPRSGGGVTHRK